MAPPSWRRVGRVVATALTVAAAAAAASSCGSLSGQHKASDYCALMPDSVGLYVGNPVTQMGYQIGTVKSIVPSMNDVRVDFTITADRQLPNDVKAIVRATSVLADRSLELVGNPGPGPRLGNGECISIGRSYTPKSMSQLIGAANNLVAGINPEGSTNVADVVRGADQLLKGTGPGINQLLTTSSRVLDSPDQVITSLGSVVRKTAQLTDLLVKMRDPVKTVLKDMQITMPDVEKATGASPNLLGSTIVIIEAVADIEANLGEETQFTLDAASMAIRKTSAHAPAIADLLTPVPWWINTIANHYNNRPWNLLQYRPPLYRVRTPNGFALCNIMNASAPGSCANVQGQPYFVDVALLQYALTKAANR